MDTHLLCTGYGYVKTATGVVRTSLEKKISGNPKNKRQGVRDNRGANILKYVSVQGVPRRFTKID